MKLTLLIVFVTLLFSRGAPSGSDDPHEHTLKSSKCNYMEMGENQDNAFIMNRRECCMCPKGFKYVGICNYSHPNTTRCEPCENGSHIHWEPHVEKKCIQKEKIDCPPLKIYHPGTTTEEDRCVCKPGMTPSESGKWCRHTPSTPSSTKHQMSSPPSTAIRPSQPTTKGNYAQEIQPTKERLPTLVDRITTSVTSNSPVSIKKVFEDSTTKQTGDQTTENSNAEPPFNRKPNDNEGKTNTVAVAVPVTVVVVFGLLLFIGILWKKRKDGPCSTHNKGDVDSTSASQSSLIHRQVKQTHDVQAHLQVTSDESETLLCTRPILDSPSQLDNRVEQYCPVQNTPQAEAVIQQPPLDALIQDPIAERNRKFALRVATQFGDKGLRKKEAKPLFRAIIDNHRADQDLDETEEKCKNSEKETIYQFMVLATQKKGKNLTPTYILEKVRDTELQEFVEIVKTEMRQPYMRT